VECFVLLDLISNSKGDGKISTVRRQVDAKGEKDFLRKFIKATKAIYNLLIYHHHCCETVKFYKVESILEHATVRSLL
jgi:hypothetical protein